jgi:acetoin utilization deacetylase AcuC-like enzyme
MKVFYLQQQTAKRNDSFSPSATKPALAVESWQQLGLPIEIVEFDPATRAQLYTVHDPHYVDGVLDLKRNNGFGNRLPEIAEALPYVAGSMVAATLHAYKTGETTFSPTSGAHHAGYDHGGGYCTFNFLALAAVEAHKAGSKKVGIIDCDMHYGDGTAEIIRTLGLHFVRHYSFGGDISCRETAEQWLARLPALVQMIAQEVDVIIYNAGADPHIDDPLGGVLTTEQLKNRDEIVFEAAQRFSVPVAVSLAGGYQKDLRKVLDVHDNTFKAASSGKYENESKARYVYTTERELEAC